jgi:hypothetical protein
MAETSSPLFPKMRFFMCVILLPFDPIAGGLTIGRVGFGDKTLLSA